MITHEEEKWGFRPHALSPSLKVTDMRTPHHLGLHMNDPVYYLISWLQLFFCEGPVGSN